MRCFRQPLAFLFLFIGLCGIARSQAPFTSLRDTIIGPILTPGATVTQAANDRAGNKHSYQGAYK
jgi:hypothetical protein